MPLPAPRTLSPSKVTSFTACPLAFRLSLIDHLPEPPSPQAVKGTLVHAALERLFWHHPAGSRTPAAAAAELDRAWEDLAEDPEFTALELGPEEAETFRTDAAGLLERYFRLEDPDAVEPVGVELLLEAEIGGVRLRGIIDRLDRRADGELVVVDYKSGRAPSERHEQGRLVGVHVYALLCEQVLGQVPAEVRLLYLRDPVEVVARPTAQSLRGQRQRTLAVWAAIERACEREDFRPSPGPLCKFCGFQDYCPSFGGTPPVYGEPVPVALAS
jgi:putative RecB family exonuclease